MICHNGQGYQTIPTARIPSSVYMATAPNGYHNNNGILVRPSTKHKSVLEAYLLVIPLGLIGAHHFYLRRPFFGLLYFFTFGLLGVGVIFDLFRLPWLVKDANNRIENPQLENKRRTDDAYLLWFVFGLLGFQHFYLKRPSLGFLYLFTFGIFGFGWLRDICFLPFDVKNANNEKKDESTETKSTLMTYAFSLWFTGILGGHHFYLRRYFFGFVYFFTFGLAGVGYLADIIRVPILVMRKNKEITTGSRPKKTLDDAYLLWFPLGILGLHHFYLNRPVWGLVYFFTFGLFGLGWLVDLFRIPFLLKTCNSEIDHSNTLLPPIGNRPAYPGYVISPPDPALYARQQPLPQYVPQSNPVPQGQIPVHQRHGPVPQGHIPVPQGYVPVSDQPPAYTQGIYPTANDSGQGDRERFPSYSSPPPYDEAITQNKQQES